MKANAARGVSLWLTPRGDERERLGALIRRLAARLGTPAFEPHVTLLGGLAGPERPLVEQARALAGAMQPLELRLGPPGVSDRYFRALFLEVARDARLEAAHAQAVAAYALDETESFFPHLSLAYGDEPLAAKRQLVDEVAALGIEAMSPVALEVVHTEGPVEAWRALACHPLTGR